MKRLKLVFIILCSLNNLVKAQEFDRVIDLEYARVYQGLNIRYHRDTSAAVKGKYLYKLDSISYLMEFSKDERYYKARKITPLAHIVLIGNVNDTLLKLDTVFMDKTILKIPTLNLPDSSRLIVRASITHHKKRTHKFITRHTSTLLDSILRTRIYSTGQQTVLFICPPLRTRCFWNAKSRTAPLPPYPINDLIIRTVPGVN